MKRSLFSRFFGLCSTIILTSIVMLGIMLVALSAQYFKQENLDALQKNATNAAELVAYNYAQNFNMYVDGKVINDSFTIFSEASEADYFLVENNGNTALCIDSGECRHLSVTIDKVIMQRALNEGYRGVSGLGGIYTEPMYVVGVPVKTANGVIGAVFAGSSASGMANFLSDVLFIFIIGAILVIVISFIVTYFTTEAMVRPLRAMLKATDSFAKGDFAVRVPVEGDEEIEQLAMAFNNMAANLATLEAARRSFIGNVSHELKTPMTTIGGFIDGILDGTIPQEKYHYYLGIVSNEVKRLSRMVVSMLNISRIEAGETQLKPQVVDINETVCRTVLGFEQRIEEKNIDIRGLDAGRIFVETDPDLVHQVTYNLIENAVKFTPESGIISIGYMNEGKMLAVSVKNSGSGIPKEEIPFLFERFYKSDRSRSMDKTGVGLGLHIVKSLVHLQGGTITVKSVEGEYTEFVFTLPTAQQKQNSLFRKIEKPKAEI
ncbi:MAG: HAMP domain-containing protein [Oscillospiraceae bacterium]|nr:HAMP domain-containing protein [Oscillospiraceae bacterium]